MRPDARAKLADKPADSGADVSGLEARAAETLALGDLRFRALLADADWARLPPSIRFRFSKRLAGGETVVYVGEVLETRLSRAGWLLAQAMRLIGAPLPTATDARVPAVVTVTEDAATGGQIWTRVYARRRSFPQVIHSSKRFAGPTGLEEYVGYGVGMPLRITVEDGALVFRNDGYFVQILRCRISLPGWAALGRLSVTHAVMDDGRFRFTLEIIHPLLGLLVRQTAAFQEYRP
jgi:hypothetical protein